MIVRVCSMNNRGLRGREEIARVVKGMRAQSDWIRKARPSHHKGLFTVASVVWNLVFPFLVLMIIHLITVSIRQYV